MKKFVFLYFLVLLFAIVLIPLSIMVGAGKFQYKNDVMDEITQQKQEESGKKEISEKSDKNEKENETEVKKIKVYNHKTKKVEKIDLEKYLVCVVSAEMPYTYELEALKAQAVAARSYTYSRVIGDIKQKDSSHKGASVCTDYKHCQAYLAYSELEKNKDKLNKISKAVDATKGEILQYNGKTANLLFHACSGGMTETAKNVWGGANVPYLKSVKSPGEEKYEQFKSQVVIDKKDFYGRFGNLQDKIVKNINTKKASSRNYVKVVKTSPSKRIIQLEVNGCVYRGIDIREAFGLKSTMFTIKTEKDKIVFNVKGYGHGVGMSQVGADAMAKTKKKYNEILAHYYQGTKLKKVY